MIAIPITDDLVRGADRLERTARGLRPQRLPAAAVAQTPDGHLAAMAAQPSGVRVELRTAATAIELVVHPTRPTFAGLSRPRGAIDLVIGGEVIASDVLAGGDAIETDLRTGTTELVTGPAHRARFDGLPAGEKTVELWLPHNETVELVELRADAPATPSTPTGPRWVHHGSSISQGSNTASPARTWPAVAARLAGARLRNLGVGGNAMVDPLMARVVRDAPADVISVGLGINVVNGDVMRLRAFVPAVHGFLDTIRDGLPDTPLILATPIFCGIHEDTPGPGAFDPEALAAGQVRFVATGTPGDTAQGRLTLAVVRDALAEIVDARRDPAMHLVDGLALYGEADAERLPLPDALHPDTETHELIGRRFAALAFGDGGAFAGARPTA